MCVTKPSPQGYWIVSPVQAQHLRGEALCNVIRLMLHCFSRRRQLRALTDLDDRLLDDIGVSRAEAEQQFAKAFRQAYARRHFK